MRCLGCDATQALQKVQRRPLTDEQCTRGPDDRGDLLARLGSVAQTQEQLRRATEGLARSLRSPNVRGRWGVAGTDGEAVDRVRPALCGEAAPEAGIVGQGAEQAWRKIQQAVALAAQEAGLGALDPAQCAIGLGLSGISLKQPVQ